MNPTSGDLIPPVERTIELADMVAYAGATWDWHRLHYDPAYLAERGLPAPVVDGQAFGAYLCQHLLDWAGPKAWVRSISFRLKSMVFADETIRVEGVVTEDDGDRVTVSQKILVGDRLCVESEAVVDMRGSATGSAV